MTIPTYDPFIDPMLRYLAKHPDGARTGEVHEALADEMGFSEEEREELLPSGVQAVYKNRIGWAHDRLKRAGLSSAPKRIRRRLSAVARKRAMAEDRSRTRSRTRSSAEALCEGRQVSSLVQFRRPAYELDHPPKPSAKEDKRTQQAVDFVQSVERIVLIDGARLTGLMIEHGVGISHRMVKVPMVEGDYFVE